MITSRQYEGSRIPYHPGALAQGIQHGNEGHQGRPLAVSCPAKPTTPSPTPPDSEECACVHVCVSLLYMICILSALLYGAKSWTPLRGDLRYLDTFHHNCIRLLLCVTNSQQWGVHMSYVQLHRMCVCVCGGGGGGGGQEEIHVSTSIIVQQRRLSLLGHIAQMPQDRMPPLTLFPWLESPRLACGPRRHWRDVINTDLRAAGMETCFQAVHDRERWRDLCEGVWCLELPMPRSLTCDVCRHVFRRPHAMAQCNVQRREHFRFTSSVGP